MTENKRYAVKSGKSQHRANTREGIRNRENFRTSGALAGGKLYNERMAPSTRLLNPEARAQWEADVNRIRYVVVSYNTPIAWHVQTCECSLNQYGRGHWSACPEPEGRWVVVSQKFSPTTTVHQGVVQNALNGGVLLLGDPGVGKTVLIEPVPYITVG